MPCLSMHQNFSVFEKGQPSNIAMKLFQNVTRGFIEDFLKNLFISV